jgi:hypothetical protein
MANDHASVKEKTKFLARDLTRFELREPREASMLQALIDEDDTRSVVPERLALFAVIAQEHEKISVQEVCLDPLAHEHREPVESGTQINVFGEHEDPVTRFQ